MWFVRPGLLWAILAASIACAGAALWSRVPNVVALRSVSWYLSNPTEFAIDYQWCHEHPGVERRCEIVNAAKMRADAAAMLAALQQRQ